MMPLDALRSLLSRAFPDAEIDLVDLNGTQDHYQARIVSTAFEGRTTLEQHRLVYGALGEVMDGPVHALALATYTPQSWTRRNGAST